MITVLLISYRIITNIYYISNYIKLYHIFADQSHAHHCNHHISIVKVKLKYTHGNLSSGKLVCPGATASNPLCVCACVCERERERERETETDRHREY